jgi:NAD(P)-dependent dehydrogenase (short-subunit alcohol dehydrogenase family)
MTSCRPAHVVGLQGKLRTRIVDAVRQAGWSVALTSAMPERLDLCVFAPELGPSAMLMEAPAQAWWACIDASLTSAFRCARDVVPRLAPSGGALVFVSSILGEIGAPGRTAACAAAAGIIGLAKALTVEIPPVRFSVVAPLIPLPEGPWTGADVSFDPASSRVDEAAIVRATANAVVFLAKDREGHHRGQVIRIPSGITT